MCAMKITLRKYMLHIEFTYINSICNNVYGQVCDLKKEALAQNWSAVSNAHALSA